MQSLDNSNRLPMFARRLFFVAGVYGLLVLLPQYFLETRIGVDDPPAVTHPEFFYGFVGVAVAWQVAFLIVAYDPPRYRLLMIPGALEKFAFAAAAAGLYAVGRLDALPLLAGAAIDLLLGCLFLVAYAKTPEPLR